MADSGDTAPSETVGQGTAQNLQVNFSNATYEERQAHFNAYESARQSGEKLDWNDERRHPWPKKDRMNWVGYRLAGLEKEITECKDAEQEESLKRVRADFDTWMLRERDGLSWSRIAQRQMKSIGIQKPESHIAIEAFESQARRACARVERSHPGSALYKPEPINLDDCCPNCGYPISDIS